jgi:NCAIR mutase (PurE)-related protein
MDELALQRLLEDVRSGACTPDDAVFRLRRLPFADLGFAKVDHHRALRQGFPEAVYGQGKSPAQCSAIVGELLRGVGGVGAGAPDAGARDAGAREEWADGADTDDRGVDRSDDHPRPGNPVILTRADGAQVERVTTDHPGGTVTVTGAATGADQVRGELATVVWRQAPPRPARTLVITAGTSDLPVAEECRATLVALGLRPTLLADCGVAGVHRLLASADELADADVVVVVAGMEGALASLVGGITPAPVVAVPTSTGYGSALEGVTALLAMHASCAAGITVVGIDNGFGAACAVARILP